MTSTTSTPMSVALLDRLAPGSAHTRVPATESWLRADILRNLDALFNAVRLEPLPDSHDENDWHGLDHVRQSTLNFGLPAWAGLPLTSSRLRWLEEAIVDALRRFEPRLLPSPMTVSVQRMAAGKASWSTGGSLQVLIQAWVGPACSAAPLSVVVELDADCRRAKLRPRRA